MIFEQPSTDRYKITRITDICYFISTLVILYLPVEGCSLATRERVESGVILACRTAKIGLEIH